MVPWSVPIAADKQRLDAVSWLVWVDGHRASPGLSLHPKHGDDFFPNSAPSWRLAALEGICSGTCTVARCAGKSRDWKGLIVSQSEIHLQTYTDGHRRSRCLGSTWLGSHWPFHCGRYWHSTVPLSSLWLLNSLTMRLEPSHTLFSISPPFLSLSFPPLSFKFLLFFLLKGTIIQQWENE